MKKCGVSCCNTPLKSAVSIMFPRDGRWNNGDKYIDSIIHQTSARQILYLHSIKLLIILICLEELTFTLYIVWLILLCVHSMHRLHIRVSRMTQEFDQEDITSDYNGDKYQSPPLLPCIVLQQ